MAVVNSVNFLRRSRVKVSKYQKWDKLFVEVSAVVLLGCLVLSVGLFGYWQYVANQLSEVVAEQKTQQRVVSQASSNEAQYVLFSSRLTSLNEILKGRTSKVRALSFLQKVLRPGVAFESITYDFQTKQLQFRAKAERAPEVESLLNALREPSIAEQIHSLTLADIRRGEEGDYTIDIAIVLKEEA